MSTPENILEAASAGEPGPPAPVRVLMVLESPYHATGGAESQVRTIARRMRTRGHSVTVVTPMREPGPLVSRDRGVLVLRLPYPRVRWLGALVLYLRLALLLVARRARYDVIHVHIAHYLGAVCCALGPLLGRPVVVKFSGWWEVERGVLRAGAGPGVRLACWCLRRASAVQAISTRLAKLLVARGFDAQRIHLLPNAVDLERFRPSSVAHPLHAAPVRRTAMFVGRLVPEKGLVDLVEAWARALAQREDWRLVLVGAGPLEQSLRALARERGIGDRVELAGHANEVEHLLATADVGLLPSLVEGLSNTLLEYLAAGLPVVASRVSGSEDLIEPGVNGWLFEPGDVDGLARALAQMAALDPGALATWSSAARRTAQQKFELDSVIARLLALYRAPHDGALAAAA